MSHSNVPPSSVPCHANVGVRLRVSTGGAVTSTGTPGGVWSTLKTYGALNGLGLRTLSRRLTRKLRIRSPGAKAGGGIATCVFAVSPAAICVMPSRRCQCDDVAVGCVVHTNVNGARAPVIAGGPDVTVGTAGGVRSTVKVAIAAGAPPLSAALSV